MENRKALIFGAGNIGRGFLGLELHKVGYNLTFVESLPQALVALNEKKGYEVEIAETGEKTFVPLEHAISVFDESAIQTAVQNAAIITTAVGPNHLKEVGRVLAKPLLERTLNENFLNVIACENMIGNSKELKNHIRKNLNRPERDKLATFIGFPSSVVDRISIPSIELTRVERSFEWVTEGDFWKAFSPPKCIDFVEELEPFLKRKLYVLNGAHSIIGYMSGNIKYVHSAMQNNSIRNIVIGHMSETSNGLAKKYEFSSEELEDYTKVVLGRFDNPAVNDLTSRLVRGQTRKLGREERLVGPALLALEAGLSPINTAKGISALLKYYDEKDPESLELRETLLSEKVEGALMKYSGLDKNKEPEKRLIELVSKEFNKL